MERNHEAAFKGSLGEFCVGGTVCVSEERRRRRRRRREGGCVSQPASAPLLVRIKSHYSLLVLLLLLINHTTLLSRAFSLLPLWNSVSVSISVALFARSSVRACFRACLRALNIACPPRPEAPSTPTCSRWGCLLLLLLLLLLRLLAEAVTQVRRGADWCNTNVGLGILLCVRAHACERA